MLGTSPERKLKYLMPCCNNNDDDNDDDDDNHDDDDDNDDDDDDNHDDDDDDHEDDDKLLSNKSSLCKILSLHSIGANCNRPSLIAATVLPIQCLTT